MNFTHSARIALPAAVAVALSAFAVTASAEPQGQATAVSTADVSGDTYATKPKLATQQERDSVDITNLRVAVNNATDTTAINFDFVDLSRSAGDQLFFGLYFPDDSNGTQYDYLRFRRGSQKVVFHDYPSDRLSLPEKTKCDDASVKMLYKREKVKVTFDSSCLDALETEAVKGLAVINNGNVAVEEKGSYIVQDEAELAKRVVFN